MVSFLTECSFSQTLVFNGVEVELTGTYDPGETGDYETPGYGPCVTEWKTAKVGGVDVSNWLETMDAYDELERSLLSELGLN